MSQIRTYLQEEQDLTKAVERFVAAEKASLAAPPDGADAELDAAGRELAGHIGRRGDGVYASGRTYLIDPHRPGGIRVVTRIYEHTARHSGRA